jgi:hypothetical protein
MHYIDNAEQTTYSKQVNTCWSCRWMAMSEIQSISIYVYISVKYKYKRTKILKDIKNITANEKYPWVIRCLDASKRSRSRTLSISSPEQ